MIAVKRKFFAKDLPDNLEKVVQMEIERRIPLWCRRVQSQVQGLSEKMGVAVRERNQGAPNLKALQESQRRATAKSTKKGLDRESGTNEFLSC
jgi:hypothetical protein